MSTQLLLRLAEHVHGHMGWLSAAALLHPAILLRNPRRRARLAVLLTTLFVTSTGMLGAWIYPEYRTQLKQAIFIHSPTVGWLFERKEHLAVGAIGFAWIGCIAHLASRGAGSEASPHVLARVAQHAYIIAVVLCVAVACIGIAVATYSTF